MNQKIELQKRINPNHGITLIALIITIIILLILAGISIGMLTGENGIITKAIRAEEESKKAQYEEFVNLIITEKQIEKSQNPSNPDPFIKIVADAIEEKEWSKEVTIYDENKEIEVQTKDGYEIIVHIDNETETGKVILVTKGKSARYSVKFDANGGSGTIPEPLEVRQGLYITLPNSIDDLWKEDKKIVGFSEVKEPKENDKIYSFGSSFQPTKNTTLYVIWADEFITLHYYSNSEEGELWDCEAKKNSYYIMPNNPFQKQGYVFLGWTIQDTQRRNHSCPWRQYKN